MTKDNIKDKKTLAKFESSRDFDSRGLDKQVIRKLKSNEVNEAEKIAKFNAMANKTEDLDQSESSNLHSKSVDVAGTEEGLKADLDPTRYGDWERKGRCYDF